MKLLHLGDIHYPDYDVNVDVDVKDASFPDRIVTLTSKTALSASLRAAAGEHATERHLLMVSGDITTFGKPEPYRRCVGLLRDIFRLDDLTDTPPDTWHVATGNHDIDRAVVSVGGVRDDEPYKFAMDAWLPHAPLPVHAPRTTSVESVAGGPAVVLTSIDSCVGGGERRTFPDEMRESMRAKWPSETDGLEIAMEVLDEVFETLDTPAFQEDHLDTVLAVIRAAPPSHLPFVLAHHNLLPQHTLRVAPYTDLLNGGDARGRLSSCGRPVVYLHGHTHVENIEIIRQERPGQGQVIAVSSRLLVEGFNKITVQFSESGRPLGLIVQPWVVRPGGDVHPVAAETVRVPLIDRRMSEHPLLASLIAAMPSDGRPSRMPVVVKAIQGMEPEASLDDVAEASIEAEWMGLLQIADRDSENRYWTLRSETL